MDASGITSIDVTAAERLMILEHTKYKERGYKALSTETIPWKNDQLRA